MNNAVEVWKPIPEYEGLYEVSNLGEIRSLYLWDGKKHRPRHAPYIMRKTKTITGYWKIELVKNGKRKSLKVHQLVAKAFIKNPLNKPNINHKDFNPLNNRVDNLEWVTQHENILYSAKHYKLGTFKGKKAREKVVKEYQEGMTILELSRKYGVFPPAFYKLLKQEGVKLEKRTKYGIDLEVLKKQFDKGLTNKELAKIHNCNSNLIARRRYQLKKGEI